MLAVAKANYKVNPNHAVLINVVLVHHKSLKNYMNVYNKIKKMANDFNSTYRLGEKPYQIVQAGDKEQHWGAIEKYFGGKNAPDSKIYIHLYFHILLFCMLCNLIYFFVSLYICQTHLF